MTETNRAEPGTRCAWTVEEFAESFKMAPATVRASIKAGTIRGVWLAPQILRIPDAEVDRFREAGG